MSISFLALIALAVVFVVVATVIAVINSKQDGENR